MLNLPYSLSRRPSHSKLNDSDRIHKSMNWKWKLHSFVFYQRLVSFKVFKRKRISGERNCSYSITSDSGDVGLVLYRKKYWFVDKPRYTRFFYKQRFFSIQPHCCLTFSSIELEMLLKCCLMHVGIIMLRSVLCLLDLCPCLGLQSFPGYWVICGVFGG